MVDIETVRKWAKAEGKRELWSPHARRGTVIVHAADKEAFVVLVDDVDGAREAFRAKATDIPDMLGALTASWMRNPLRGSLNLMLAGKGSLPPRPPTPPPGPIGDDELAYISVKAHYEMLGFGELVFRGRFDAKNL